MVDRAHVQAWLAGYERAWRSPGTGSLSDLFTDGATYSLEPFGEPVVGLGPIAEMWEAERLGPEERFTMDSQVVAVDGDVAVARVHVRYQDPVPHEYRDLWIIHFAPDGRCQAFEAPGAVSGCPGQNGHSSAESHRIHTREAGT
jgi:hypothetical protein